MPNNELSYPIPDKKQEELETTHTVFVKNDDDGTQTVVATEEEADETKTVTNKKRQIDASYRHPFEIGDMNQEGNNMVQSAYQWLQSNVELFADFEAC